MRVAGLGFSFVGILPENDKFYLHNRQIWAKIVLEHGCVIEEYVVNA